MEGALTAILQSQEALQNAVAELCARRPEPRRAPRDVLTKLTGDEDVEAFLEIFERTAQGERWPPEEWGRIIAPFLTGEAQRAYRDLSSADAQQYPMLKAAILSRYGYSLPARAQRYHDWAYDPTSPVRAQVCDLARRTRRWLVEGDGPALLERIILDRCVRALPPGAKRYVAEQGPRSMDHLIAMLENHQVTQEMLRPGRATAGAPGPSPTRTAGGRQNPPGQPVSLQHPRTPAGPQGVAAATLGALRERRRCFACGQAGHLALDCPGREEAMASADTTGGKGQACHYLTTCWAHQGAAPPRLPVKIGGRDTEALLDSGSAITLVRPEFAREGGGEAVSVSCVHGDTRQYPTATLTLQSPRGQCVVRAGVVEGLPVPVLLGRDCPLFHRYWQEGPGTDPPRPGPLTRRSRRAPQPACAASNGGRDGEATPREGGSRRPTGDSGTATAPEGSQGGTFSDYRPHQGKHPAPPTDFGTAQLEDPNLAQAWRSVAVIEGTPQEGVSRPPYPYFAVVDGLLYRFCQVRGEEVAQLLVPRPYVTKVLYLAHTHLLGAHLGGEKTYDRVTTRFYWPGVKKAVEDYCRHCAECQLHSPKVTCRNPLIPLPIIDVPFRRLGMDILGPLPKSSRGHRYVLVLMDYATRYPEAVPLRTATGKTIAKELFLLYSRVGIVEEILTDQGTCFMSQVMREMCRLLHVTQLRTSVYHPQTDGLVERFNKTLKSMLRKLIEVDGKDWDQLLPYLMFAVREVPQSSTGFAPFELLYGRRPRGLLDLAKDAWEQQPSRHRSLIEHVETMDQRMGRIWPMVREHMGRVQAEQARLYNRNAQVREFRPGDRVMVLVPTSECKFLAKWHGPYEVLERVGQVNYKVRQPGRRHCTQLYHVNLLKRWHDPGQVPEAALVVTYAPQVPPEVPLGSQLTPDQRQEMQELVSRNRDVFSTTPGRTDAITHDIVTEPGRWVKLRPYRIPEARRQVIREEVQRMLGLGVIEESHSAWSSPIVLVKKTDGSWRFCNDFRKLNEISLCDAYPMPRIDELIERLGPARFISTLDLTRGYWQVPLTPQAKEKTAFATPDGLYQYKVLPFGVHGAPATFQRLMDRVLRPHQQYAAAYLDDIVIHSETWEDHGPRVEAVLQALREAGLTANPTKCHLGVEEANYLGHVVGRGCIRPQARKVESIGTWPQPSTKRQVRTFLGLVGYYRQFIQDFATRAAPLHDLTKKTQPNRVKWTPEAEAAFQDLREALCQEPVLVTPNFNSPFILHTDASEGGIGAVLSQVQDAAEHPISFISRRLLSHERNYATVEKECLAIKWAIGKLRYYLLGREFTLITDHAPLKWMALNKDNNARVTRWFLELQAYRFRVEHRAGRLHTNADAMSRRGDCHWADAPPRGGELRGGICGTPPLGWCTTGLEDPPRRRQGRRGQVLNGEYYPYHLFGRSAPWPAARA